MSDFQKAAEEMARKLAPTLNAQQQRLVNLQDELVSKIRYWANCSVALEEARSIASDPRGIYPAAQTNRAAEAEVVAALSELAKLTKEFIVGGELWPEEVGR